MRACVRVYMLFSCIADHSTGVGGIEAEAVMLGQTISMVLPKVVGYRLIGSISKWTTSTDVVLTITKVTISVCVYCIINIKAEFEQTLGLTHTLVHLVSEWMMIQRN